MTIEGKHTEDKKLVTIFVRSKFKHSLNNQWMYFLIKSLFLEAGCHSLCISSEEPSFDYVVAQ